MCVINLLRFPKLIIKMTEHNVENVLCLLF